jgi:hypothetical protein
MCLPARNELALDCGWPERAAGGKLFTLRFERAGRADD